jgi:hypothetical protein
MVFIGAVLVLGNIIAMRKASDYGRREAVLFASIPMAVSQSALALVVAYNQLLGRMDLNSVHECLHVLLRDRFRYLALDHLHRDLPSKPEGNCPFLLHASLLGLQLRDCLLVPSGG